MSKLFLKVCWNPVKTPLNPVCFLCTCPLVLPCVLSHRGSELNKLLVTSFPFYLFNFFLVDCFVGHFPEPASMWLHKCCCWYEIGWDHVQRLRKMGLWHPRLARSCEAGLGACFKVPEIWFVLLHWEVFSYSVHHLWHMDVLWVSQARMELCQHKSGSMVSSKHKPNCFVALSSCTASTWWLFLNTPVSKFLFTEDVFLDLLFLTC